MASLTIVSEQVTTPLPLLDRTTQTRKRVSISDISAQNSSMISRSSEGRSKESQPNCKGRIDSSSVLSNTGWVQYKVVSVQTICGSRITCFWQTDRKSTRLNSSHVKSSYAVFC